MRKETRELYRQAYEKWDDAQFAMVCEECAELIQAVSKFWRDPSSEHIDNLVEEIADVQIMAEQLEAMLDCSKAAMRIRRKKLRRLKKLLFKSEFGAEQRKAHYEKGICDEIIDKEEAQ